MDKNQLENLPFFLRMVLGDHKSELEFSFIFILKFSWIN